MFRNLPPHRVTCSSSQHRPVSLELATGALFSPRRTHCGCLWVSTTLQFRLINYCNEILRGVCLVTCPTPFGACNSHGAWQASSQTDGTVTAQPTTQKACCLAAPFPICNLAVNTAAFTEIAHAIYRGCSPLGKFVLTEIANTHCNKKKAHALLPAHSQDCCASPFRRCSDLDILVKYLLTEIATL